MIDLAQIIEVAKSLNLRELLIYLVAKFGTDLSKDKTGKLKQIIQDKFNEKKYAFVPNKEEAETTLAYIIKHGVVAETQADRFNWVE